jgi:type II secretory pathway component PulF
MINVGEVSGNLSETFEYLAEFYEDEMDSLSKNLSTVIEPVLLLVIGVLVAFMALSIILPIGNIIGGINR